MNQEIGDPLPEAAKDAASGKKGASMPVTSRDYFAELYVAGILGDCGWHVYFRVWAESNGREKSAWSSGAASA